MEEQLHILVDADSVYFRTCMVTQKQHEVRKGLSRQMRTLENACGLFVDNITQRIAVKGSGNFRHDIYDEYKGNRKRELEDNIKECLWYAHKHMCDEYGAIRCDGMEADDMVAIWAWECIREGLPYVVVHIDKDLDMIPGAHYNFVKDKHYMVDFDQAHYNFMRQILTGDTADNIPGVKGIGPKKSEKLLEGVPFDRRWKVVQQQWTDKKQMLISARLLWMATTQEEADSANEKMLERLDAKTLDEFWLGKQEVQDEDNEEPSEGETSECESDVREEGQDDLQDS